MPLTNSISKFIIDLSLKCKNAKLLVENIGESLDDLEFDNEFLDTTPKV